MRVVKSEVLSFRFINYFIIEIMAKLNLKILQKYKYNMHCFKTIGFTNLYPGGWFVEKFIVWETWKWLLNPLFNINFPPSNITGNTSEIKNV